MRRCRTARWSLRPSRRASADFCYVAPSTGSFRLFAPVDHSFYRSIAAAARSLRSPVRLASLIPQAFSADHFGTCPPVDLAGSMASGRQSDIGAQHFLIA
jgi:hypothetical protein